MTNAVFMPAVLNANRAAIEAKIARLAAYMGLEGGFDGFTAFVTQLRAELCVPDNLAGLGVPREGFEQILSMSLEDPTAGGNPLPLTRELAGKMLEAAFG
jgi:alcohol dehydrogenase